MPFDAARSFYVMGLEGRPKSARTSGHLARIAAPLAR